MDVDVLSAIAPVVPSPVPDVISRVPSSIPVGNDAAESVRTSDDTPVAIPFIGPF